VKSIQCLLRLALVYALLNLTSQSLEGGVVLRAAENVDIIYLRALTESDHDLCCPLPKVVPVLL
jgi:hypothetical protein